ncbi:peptidase C14 [Rozella allomycis CSF55]|uniref:Peptidase C14 n=1 Tax=Rozella allomycis (strain CSF55) TaxID=988480 RepID=A0A4P9YA93_ROZAC|nr:peptidase C14 [Rozella allomycis CSF55]
MQTVIYNANGTQQTANYPLSTCTGYKKALLIGINYANSKSPLRGCHNDVLNMKQFIMNRFGYRDDPSSMVILMDDPRITDTRYWPTKANIIYAMSWLVAGLRPGDSCFFHFSGHGSQRKDYDGDEVDGYDETILPVDYSIAGEIIDDEMHSIMVKNLPVGVRLTAIFDSCHSGTALDLPYVYDNYGNLVMSYDFYSATGAVGIAANALGKKLDKLTGSSSSHSQINNQRQTWSDVIMFSGCADNQTSADVYDYSNIAVGAMSSAFLQSLNNNPRQTYSQLLASTRSILSQRYRQVPQLTSGHPMDMGMLFTM